MKRHLAAERAQRAAVRSAPATGKRLRKQLVTFVTQYYLNYKKNLNYETFDLRSFSASAGLNNVSAV